MIMSLTASLALALSLQASEPIAAGTLQPSATAITELMRAHHYNPADLDDPAYLAIEAGTLELGETATDQADFLRRFRDVWADAPFSHVRLTPARGTAAELAASIDTLNIGGGGAVLSWHDDTAILNVTSMIGQDTIAEINAAYVEIAERGADALIIDLRQNGGGAFAVRPLVEHVVTEPLDAGVFVSQPWNAAHDRAPQRSDLADVPLWEGWSLVTFWNAVQTEALTPIGFQPAEDNHFDGPLYVLTSNETASAAELAADALKASGRAILVGETTAGEMLSQTVFDVPGGLQLWLPIADYYSLAYGRIEGVGVAPDIAADAGLAQDIALDLIARR
ncbi:S41 family peptidase [Maricaulis maris]|jgi:carboxyl-terminal processing protease|uniref:S41 family peptidase n=1 Tax=Maricaulis maris TaxID=74318 RepID=UPI0026EA767D|nr:S41 family peptidase [Maricaulis maris]